MVTDNAGNYVVVGKLISKKYKHINWSPGAAHCLNLSLQDAHFFVYNIAKLARSASNVTIFVYNHVYLLSWLRKRK